ncbi:MAG: rod shape-determining protein MreC [Holosporales bacterium]|jgi:rod shape-determining protein MreC|nr:rod shape-determining protein MreC [Holosporales bacterium]
MFGSKIRWRFWLHWGGVVAFVCLLVAADRFNMLSCAKNWIMQITTFGARSVVSLTETASRVLHNFSGESGREILRLKQELIACKTDLEKLKYLQTGNNRLRSALNFPLNTNNEMVAFATILKVHELLTCNEIYLNKGSESGIDEGNVVIGQSGIIGVVKTVGHKWSQVKRITSASFFMSVCFSPSGMLAILKGDGDGRLRIYLKENDSTIKVPEGQLAFTDGHDEIFPAGILVGKVDNDERVIPSCGISQVGIVCVVKQQLRDK